MAYRRRPRQSLPCDGHSAQGRLCQHPGGIEKEALQLLKKKSKNGEGHEGHESWGKECREGRREAARRERVEGQRVMFFQEGREFRWLRQITFTVIGREDSGEKSYFFRSLTK